MGTWRNNLSLSRIVFQLKIMKALILVGGFGTRLRPLTCRIPKQLLPLANTTLIEFMISRLQNAGITEIILAAGYGIRELETALGDGSHLGVTITYSPEKEPLGTAGPIRQAEAFLKGSGDFFVLNGDIIAQMDYVQQLQFHKAKRATATLALYQVDNPSRYGVVDLTPTGQIRAFIEKPAPGSAPSNLINAGCYVLNEKVLELIPLGKKTSIERQTFPKLVKMGGIFGWEHKGLWVDTGTPQSYLEANQAILQAMMEEDEDSTVPVSLLQSGVKITPPVIIGKEVQVADSVQIGPNVIVGDRVLIGANSLLQNTVIFNDAIIGEGVEIKQSVVGEGAVIGQGLHLTQFTLIGDGAIIDKDVEIPSGGRVCPNKHVKPGADPHEVFC
jgi:mannose-1-phosphate guanylyltransferase